MHPNTMQEVARARQRDLLKEAEQWRLARQAQADQPSLSARLLERLGSLLIKAGERLRSSVPHKTLGRSDGLRNRLSS
jgi:hypothetical protein